MAAQIKGMVYALLLPVLILMAATVLVTRGIERAMPESMGGIVATLVVSGLVMWLVSAGLFAGLYLWRGVSLDSVLGAAQGLRHFLWLGARAALVWGPVLLLVVVTAPRRWRHNTW